MARETLVNSGKVAGHRKLRLASIDDAFDEADRLVIAERAGRLECMGNWSLGQTLGHLAAWAEFSFTGAPVRVPWLIRLFLKMRKRAFLNESMPRGVRIPRIRGGTLGTEPMGLDEAMVRFRTAFKRLGREAPTKPNVIFGPLTHEEWIKLNLRHAELHMGYLREKTA